jgi:hypothetical protein
MPNRPDLIKLYDGLLKASMWLVFDPPLPDWLLPGHSEYLRGVRAIDAVIDAMVAVRCFLVAWLLLWGVVGWCCWVVFFCFLFTAFLHQIPYT